MEKRVQWRLGVVGNYFLGFLRVFFYLNFFLIALLILRDVHGLNAFLLNPAQFLTTEGVQVYLATVLTLSALLQGLSLIGVRRPGNNLKRLEQVAGALTKEGKFGL